MICTAEDITKYQDLCRRYFGEEVDEGQAAEELHELIFVVSLMYHPELQDRIDVENEVIRKHSSRKINGPIKRPSIATDHTSGCCLHSQANPPAHTKME